LKRGCYERDAQPGSQAGLRKSAQPLTFTLGIMSLREKFSAQRKGAQRMGYLAAICTVFPAIAISGFIAINTFWWCPEGGCSLDTWSAKARAFGNILGLLSLIVAFSLVLQFPFVMFSRIFCSKKTVEDTFLGVSIPLFGWHDKLMRKWINYLWSK